MLLTSFDLKDLILLKMG